jgi:cyclopropane fatty-acyl-phospholipid synthase-like methyltransferase
MRERALLHAGGTPGTWGNLGLWPAPDYAQACAALARCVGQAAGLQAGSRVLSVGCGAGDELALWVREFGAAHVLGLEPEAGSAAAATRFAGAGVRVEQLPWYALTSAIDPAVAYDAVVCVDAAYHFSPRSAFLAAAWRALRPGGRLAFTDLVVEPLAPSTARWPARVALRLGARLAGVQPDDLLDSQAGAARLAQAGFTDVHVQRLDEAVLDGFARFARQQQARLGRQAAERAWRRVAVTARLVPACRAAGLGMVLLAGARPAGPAPGASVAR